MVKNVIEETNQGGDTGEGVEGFSGAERKAGLSRCRLKDIWKLQSELHGAVGGERSEQKNKKTNRLKPSTGNK